MKSFRFVSGAVSVVMAVGLVAPDALAATTPTSNYTPTQKAILLDGKVVSRPYGIVSGGTTYMPIWYVMQVLSRLGFKSSWDGRTWNLVAPASLFVDLSNLPPTAGAKTIAVNGHPMYHVNSIVAADPAASWVQTTYMPIWYVQQVLHCMGISDGWDGTSWRITSPAFMQSTIASATGMPTLRMGDTNYAVTKLQDMLNAVGFDVGPVDGNFGPHTQAAVEKLQSTQRLPATGVVDTATWTALYSLLAQVPPPQASQSGGIVFGWVSGSTFLKDAVNQSQWVHLYGDHEFTVKPDGSVAGVANSSLTTLEKTNGAEVYASVTNEDESGFNGALINSILNDSSLSATLERNLVNLAVTNGLTGINLDFENVDPGLRQQLTKFITDLHSQLHAAGKKLCVTVPAETGLSAEPWFGAFDYAGIGQSADLVLIMAYDFNWAGSTIPGAIAPLWWDDRILAYATSVIPKGKILLGIGAYGYDWTPNNTAAVRSLIAADALMAQYHVTPMWDASDNVPYFTYKDAGGIQHTVYYENQASIQRKLDLASHYGIAGICIWKLGLEDQGFWAAVGPYVAAAAGSTSAS